MLPRRGLRRGRIGWLGLLAPAAALGLGILLLRLLAGGPHALALVGAVATPVLAAARWRRAPLSVTLWLVAWLAHGLVAQAAAVTLIVLAAATVAEVAAVIAPAWSLAAGLVVLCVVDVVLVWATPQVGPATTALHRAPLPSAAGHPIPRLGDATFGSATMGWLDFAAAALLGIVVTRRVRAAVATGLAAGAWGLLLVVTSVVPATVPTLLGLVTSRIR
ncbi:MAG TPA: hypothetical protein VHQ89_12125 [Gaiellaceae bacterium]|nr:hypothetical protein [Gaiellaceae bacterium]